MISVCVATYNGEKFIESQLKSILSQIDREDEVIISDDGSSDKTLEIIKSLNDDRIKVFHHKKKSSFEKIKESRNFYYVTSNFENALLKAKGDYIFLSDQDDIWADDRVKIMISSLENYDCVMCNYAVIDSESNLLSEKYYDKNPIAKSLFQNIVASNFLGCCMSFNRKVLELSLPFPKKLLAHDYWIGCLSNIKYKFKFIEEPLHFYRRTGNNVSPSVVGSHNRFLYKIKYRIFFLFQIIIHLIYKKVKK